jgi:hypothetical protein
MQRGNPVVTDFSGARRVGCFGMYIEEPMTCAYVRPPESWAASIGHAHSPPNQLTRTYDVFSWAVVVLGIVIGREPFLVPGAFVDECREECDVMAVMLMVMRAPAAYLDLYTHPCKALVQELLAACLVSNPRTRASWRDVIARLDRHVSVRPDDCPVLGCGTHS